MITALDQLNVGPSLSARQQAAAPADPGLFAASLDQALAGDAATQAQAVGHAPSPNTALLATQVAQIFAAQAASDAAANPPRTPAEEKSLRDQAVLGSMQFQASVAFGQGNVAAFTTISALMTRQMEGMGLIAPPATKAQAASPAKANPAPAAKTPVAAKKTSYSVASHAASGTANAATASNAATTSSATASNAATSASAGTASNASQAQSATAGLADALLSNASTLGSSSAVASNAGTGGQSAQASAQVSGDSGGEASTLAELERLTLELKTLLSGLEGDDLDKAMAELETMAQVLERAKGAQTAPAA